jgi:hypothetical protein
MTNKGADFTTWIEPTDYMGPVYPTIIARSATKTTHRPKRHQE